MPDKIWTAAELERLRRRRIAWCRRPRPSSCASATPSRQERVPWTSRSGPSCCASRSLCRCRRDRGRSGSAVTTRRPTSFGPPQSGSRRGAPGLSASRCCGPARVWRTRRGSTRSPAPSTCPVPSAPTRRPCDDSLARHLRVLAPPDRQPLQHAAQHDPDHLQPLPRRRSGDFLGARLGCEEGQDGGTAGTGRL